MDKKQIALDFIKKQLLGVLATTTPESKPEAAVIEFGETDDFELVFDTSITYRKYNNLKNNPNIAFVVGGEKNISIQLEGLAKELTEEESAKYKQSYFKKNPDAQKWEKLPDTRWFKIMPHWLRYRDYNSHPTTVWELEF